jgi:hypothetical protein
MHFIKETHYEDAVNAGRCGVTGQTAFTMKGPHDVVTGTHPAGAE